MNKVLTPNLRALRQDKIKTQIELAEMMQIPAWSIKLAEKECPGLTEDQVEMAAKILGTTSEKIKGATTI